jgi:adenylyltransferase/sulfurtransferase
MMVFDARQAHSACYHCIFPETGHDDAQDRCAVMGVFAPLTQQIGALQAAAAIKLITGVGRVALNQLQMFNALDGSLQALTVNKDPHCAACGAVL